MKTVLITGAGGFLGSHLAMHHLNIGDHVIGIDNFCSSDRDSGHIKRLCRDSNFTLLQRDVCEVQVDHYPMNSREIDIIYNFACPASPPRYQAIPIETMLTCVVGTRNMLELAKYHDAVLVHASTSEIYGDPDVSPQREAHKGSVNSYGPRACYDEGKRAAEALCFDYAWKYGVDARLVRIFNTYGPHMHPDDGRVVSNFIVQALRGEPLTIYGHGQQTRSFCYVDDLVRGIVAMGALPMNPKTPINLGNPNEFTISELANGVAKLIGGNSVRKSAAMPVDDPRQRRPDITYAKDLLGWEPRVQLEEGLTKTIEYFKELLK